MGKGGEERLGNKQWEYLTALFRDVGNINLAVLVIGQFVLEEGIDPSLFSWGIVISIFFYVAGFLLTFPLRKG